MLSFQKMKAECRPPLPRRKNLKLEKMVDLPVLQMAAEERQYLTNNSLDLHGIIRKENIGKAFSREELIRDLESRKETDEDTDETRNLKEILLVNINFIQQQQELLGLREKEIKELQKENETLRCRLERMDRRMSLMRNTQSPVANGNNECLETDTPTRSEHSKALKRKNTLEPQSLVKKFVTVVHDDCEKESNRTVQSDSADTPITGGSTPRKRGGTLQERGIRNKRSMKNRLKRRHFSSPLSRRTASASSLNNRKQQDFPLCYKEDGGMLSDASSRGGGGGGGDAMGGLTPRALRNRNHSLASPQHNFSDSSETGLHLSSTTRYPSTIPSSAHKSLTNSSSRKRLSLSVSSQNKFTAVSSMAAKKVRRNDLVPVSDRELRRRKVPQDESILKTPVEYYVPEDTCNVEITPKKADLSTVQVPTFRIKTFTPYYVIDGRENFEDEVYLERHKKPENEEKKRKRWDLQKQREEEQRQKLLLSSRYQDNRSAGTNNSKGKQENNNDTDFTTLQPDPANIKYIEVCDELPVSVFGYPLPSVQSQEFTLPWFDSSSKDKEENKKCRNRKR